jgi:hypothetical protein
MRDGGRLNQEEAGRLLALTANVNHQRRLCIRLARRLMRTLQDLRVKGKFREGAQCRVADRYALQLITDEKRPEVIRMLLRDEGVVKPGKEPPEREGALDLVELTVDLTVEPGAIDPDPQKAETLLRDDRKHPAPSPTIDAADPLGSIENVMPQPKTAPVVQPPADAEPTAPGAGVPLSAAEASKPAKRGPGRPRKTEARA